MVRIKEKIFLSYLDKRVEVLPRLKKFKKFKKCKTISDFARIVYYERHKGKNAIWGPIRNVVFKKELALLEYGKHILSTLKKSR